MITAQDFYSTAQDSFKLTIAAGKQGLNRPAVWLYLAEDTSSFSFIRGGELAITTGMSITDSKELQEFILSLIEKNTSGLIINIGKYITADDITPQIKAICDKNGFLLLTMPWEMHLSDIMQSFADLHFSNRLKEDNMKNALTELCHSADSIHKHSEFLLLHSLMPTDKYAIGLIKITDRERLFMHSLVTNVKNIFFTDENPMLVLFHNTDRAELEKYTELILSSARETNTVIYIGISTINTGWESLCKSFSLAEKALRLAEYKNQPYFACENGGLYPLFMHLDSSTVQGFALSLLTPLTQYDSEHNAELVKTLSAYIKYRGSLKAVAENTACHRNTVAYRIGKIKQLLNSELDDGSYLAALSAACDALEYTQALT